MITIVAFLQNPWFRPGTSQQVIQMYRDDQVFHRRILMGSISGAKLYAALGAELYAHIHWDNASWAPGNTRSSATPTDMSHVRRVISEIRPRLIVCFGKQARTAVRAAFEHPWYDVIEFPHPNKYGLTKDDVYLWRPAIIAKIDEICIKENIIPSPILPPLASPVIEEVRSVNDYRPPTT